MSKRIRCGVCRKRFVKLGFKRDEPVWVRLTAEDEVRATKVCERCWQQHMDLLPVQARRCYLCRTLLGPTTEDGSKQFDIWTPVYCDRNEQKSVNNLCAACWARHLELEAAAREEFRRANPLEPLCAALQDRDEPARRSAAETLGKLGDQRAVDALCAAMLDQGRRVDDATVAMIKALGDIGGDRAAAGLMAALRDDRFWVEEYYLDMSSKCAESCIAPTLSKVGGLALVLRGYVEALEDTKESIRENAARELQNIAWRSLPGGFGENERKLRENDLELLLGPLRSVIRHDTARVGFYARSTVEHLAELFPNSMR